MAEPPENGVRMVVFLTEVDFKNEFIAIGVVFPKNQRFIGTQIPKQNL